MKHELPTHIVIDNLPGSPWYQQWIPIIIAVASIIISLFSIYYTSNTFRINSRPFIWAVNFATKVNDTLITNSPELIRLVCISQPAKVNFKISITLGSIILFTYSKIDDIQFPDGSQWKSAIGREDFNRIMNRSVQDQALLQRIIELEYSDLDGRGHYKSILKQEFVPAENQWNTISTEAN